ncbi:Autophagy-related protein 2-like protein 1 [Seiridium cupressi]
MHLGNDELRRRRTAPKVRTGCLQCKKARVKCDEQQPICRRCIRIGLQCEYRKPKNSASSLRASPPLRVLLPRRSGSIPLGSPSPGSLATRELVYLDYFQDRVAPLLSVYGCQEFWNRDILRESQRDSIVLSALIALGALSRAIEEDDRRIPLGRLPLRPYYNHYYQEALQCYTQALSLFRALDTVSRRTILISSFLFASFELMQGNTDVYSTILAKALDSLQHAYNFDGADIPRYGVSAAVDDEGVRQAEICLPRLIAFNGKDDAIPWHQPPKIRISIPINVLIPRPGTKLKHFCANWDNFYTQISWFSHCVQGVLDADSPQDLDQIYKEKSILADQASEWKYAARELQTRTSCYSDRRALQRIVFVSGMCSVYLKCFCVDDYEAQSRLWDMHVHEAQAVLDDMRAFVDMALSLVKSSLISEDLLPMLGQMLQGCRDEGIRRQGLGLMRRVVDSSSGWHFKTSFIGRLAQISIEEEGRDTTGHIPVNHRYRWTTCSWNQDLTEAYVMLERIAPDDEGPPLQMQVLMDPQSLGLGFGP